MAKKTYEELDRERKAKEAEEAAARQKRIQEAQQEYKDAIKPPEPPKPKPPRSNPLEDAKARYEEQRAAAEKAHNDAEAEVRSDLQKKALNDAAKALAEMQAEFNKRKASGWVTSNEETEFNKEQAARQNAYNEMQQEFKDSEAKRIEDKKKAAGQSKEQQDQRDKEEQRRKDEEKAKRDKEQEKRDKEKKDWEDWNDQNNKNGQAPSNYPVELDAEAPMVGELNFAKNDPGAEVTATKPDCRPLAETINKKIAEFQELQSNASDLFGKISDLVDRFEMEKSKGKNAFKVMIQGLQAVTALQEACKKLNKCNTPEFRTNLDRYAKEVAVATETLKNSTAFVQKTLVTLKEDVNKIQIMYNTAVGLGSEVNLNLRPAFIRCEAGDGAVKVKITEPSGSESGSESGASGDSGDSGDKGSTSVTGTITGSDQASVSGASGASGTSGTIA